MNGNTDPARDHRSLPHSYIIHYRTLEERGVVCSLYADYPTHNNTEMDRLPSIEDRRQTDRVTMVGVLPAMTAAAAAAA